MKLSIDPSINHIGYAIFVEDDFNCIRLHKVGKFNSKVDDSLGAKLGAIACRIGKIVADNPEIDEAVVEIPASFSFRQKFGKTVNQDGLNKLSMSAGLIIGVLVGKLGWQSVKLVVSTDWKGRGKNARTKEDDRRIANNWARGMKLNEHEADAICLGVFAFKVG